MIVRVHIGRAIPRSPMARSAMAALIAVVLAGAVLTGVARPAAAQGTAAPSAVHQPSPAALLVARQILEIKHVEDVFKPMIRGVVIKTRDMFMQTNFMWGKDLNEIAANLEKEYSARTKELLRPRRADLCHSLFRAGIEAALEFLPIAAWPESH